MGCFDTLSVVCPCCNNSVEFQTKAGDCNLETYSIYNAPPIIAGALDGETKTCDNCGAELTIKVQTLVGVDTGGRYILKIIKSASFRLTKEEVEKAIAEYVDQRTTEKIDVNSVNLVPQFKREEIPSCHPSDCHTMEVFDGVVLEIVTGKWGQSS